jgi:asparagine synthase (glutamine-hydrolysing)
MCGIVGFVKWRGASSREALQATAMRMADAIRHRGPDYGSVWCDPDVSVTLAHRRLSILELSPAGHQPMESEDGRFVIVFNGEVYNHLDIRAELAAAGKSPAWRGHSDTETMLAAIVAWGIESALERFVGMFAFAVWDRQQRALYLARDRIGEKPLYYGWLGESFVFASELKALREHPHWTGEVDRGALTLMMRHNYVPAPYSIYRRIHKLLPSSVLTLRYETHEPEITPYWSVQHVIAEACAHPASISPSAAVAQLEDILSRAVAGQMIADVPIGAFLSGGIDSSIVVALMQKQSNRPVRTFSIGFHEAEYNEASHARRVARHLGTDHTEIYATPKEAMDVIPLLPSIYDEPFADSSQLPTYLVAKLARQSVTVALSGDGGDELFSGYDRYSIGDHIWRMQRTVPRVVRRAAVRGIRAISPGNWNMGLRLPLALVPPSLRYKNPGYKLHRLARILEIEKQDEMYLGLVSYWDKPETVVKGGYEPLTAITGPRGACQTNSFVERMMSLDLISYLPDDILVKVDRAAMAVSLETRIPLLDHRVVQFAWSLPQKLKIRNGQSKWILRQIIDKYVPRAIMERPKMGFGVPIDFWLRGPLRDWAEALIRERRLQQEGFFHPGAIRQKWREHLAGTHDWQYLLWGVLMFQAWLENSHDRKSDIVAAERIVIGELS